MPNLRLTADRASRLAFVRQLLLRAEQDADRPEPTCAVAVLILHDAAELFLVLAAEATGAAIKASALFLDYWQPIDDRLIPAKLGHKASMKVVSDARRGLKHSGILPSRSEVQRFTRATREFLTAGTTVVFGAEFDRLTMSEVLPIGRARDCLKAAEEAVGRGEADSALKNARLSLEYSLQDANNRPMNDSVSGSRRKNPLISNPPRPFRAASNLGLKKVDRKFADAWDELKERAERTEAAVYLMSRGVDYEDYTLFRTLTPTAFFPIGRDEPILITDGNRTSTFGEAIWCVEFATRASLALHA